MAPRSNRSNLSPTDSPHSLSPSPSVRKRNGRSPGHEAPPGRPKNYLAPLRATQMLSLKPVLPAELLAAVLDHLPAADLISVARTSKRMQEMVYEDTRWVRKLNDMGVWKETEARKKFEEVRQKRETIIGTGSGINGINGMGGIGSGPGPPTSTHRKTQQRRSLEGTMQPPTPQSNTMSNGFDPASLTSSSLANGLNSSTIHARRDTSPTAALSVIKDARSIRGAARQEYGKIHGALARFYYDLVKAQSHSDPILFKTYKDPTHQAQMLNQIRVFARADSTQGWYQRQESVEHMIAVFENAALREFEQGYRATDVEGKMNQYAHVLCALNGGAAAVDLFISSHQLLRGNMMLVPPMLSLQNVQPGEVNIAPSQDFFRLLAGVMNEESDKIDKVFPEDVDVMLPFLERVVDEVICDYVTPLFDEAHKGNMETYLKLAATVFSQAMQFASTLIAPGGHNPASSTDTPATIALRQRDTDGLGFSTYKAKRVVARAFEPHVDLYLSEELDLFKKKADAEVDAWDQRLIEQEKSAESFYMSNVNRQAAKQDFMTSFKKVLMMPVNVIPNAFATSKEKEKDKTPQLSLTPNGSTTAVNDTVRSDSPNLSRSDSPSPYATQEAPTTELAAKAAIMNTKLAGLNSLFSLEVSLSMVHHARTSLERCVLFRQMPEPYAAEASEQCEVIFVQLLQILGIRHVRPGFDKAVSHLSAYNPREAVEQNASSVPSAQQSGVKPLVAFLELVNIGDLIQQMVDVFYVQELVSAGLTDRDDFLNAAVKEKKRFEQMLDERVAAGLNKGIDVLMDEVEFVCATQQQPTDYNPEGGAAAGSDSNTTAAQMTTFGEPTPMARQVVDLVSTHTRMLVGSTDKNTLDVFNAEVGLRLFNALCKHLKRQRISETGSLALMADTQHYYTYIETLKNKELLTYFKALRELSQIFLIEGKDSGRGREQLGKGGKKRDYGKEIAAVIADGERYGGVFRAEEVLEFAERRADWFTVRAGVERGMYGMGCSLM